LNLGVSSGFEDYDYPGGYAKRFDGVNPSGGDDASQLQKIFTDNTRTVELRAQADTMQGVLFTATSDCRQLGSGYKFELQRHFSDSADGKYFVVVGAEHSAGHPTATARTPETFRYSNRFTSIPLDLPFRPPRTTPVPVVQGSQTAVVVGPS